MTTHRVSSMVQIGMTCTIFTSLVLEGERWAAGTHRHTCSHIMGVHAVHCMHVQMCVCVCVCVCVRMPPTQVTFPTPRCTEESIASHTAETGL